MRDPFENNRYTCPWDTQVDEHWPTDGEHRAAEQINWIKQNIMTLLIIGLTATAACFAYSTYKETRIQAEAASAEFKNNHRAKLRFRRIELDGPIEKGQVVSGRIEMLNNGDIEADILDSEIEVFWSNKSLPSVPPIPIVHGEINEPFFEANRFAPGSKGILRTDDRWFASFASKKIMGDQAISILTNNSQLSLYIVGFVAFSNGVSSPDPKERRSYYRDFGFRYNPRTSRFEEMTDDNDYDCCE